MNLKRYVDNKEKKLSKGEGGKKHARVNVVPEHVDVNLSVNLNVMPEHARANDVPD